MGGNGRGTAPVLIKIVESLLGFACISLNMFLVHKMKTSRKSALSSTAPRLLSSLGGREINHSSDNAIPERYSIALLVLQVYFPWGLLQHLLQLLVEFYLHLSDFHAHLGIPIINNMMDFCHKSRLAAWFYQSTDDWQKLPAFWDYWKRLWKYRGGAKTECLASEATSLSHKVAWGEATLWLKSCLKSQWSGSSGVGLTSDNNSNGNDTNSILHVKLFMNPTQLIFSYIFPVVNGLKIQWLWVIILLPLFFFLHQILYTFYH